MRDIAKEMDGIDGVTLEMCDAAAFNAIKKELIEQEYAEKLKSATTHERNKLALERADKLEKLRP
jgi:hypothetical protein